MDSYTQLVSDLISAFGRRISPRLSSEERISRLVQLEFPDLSKGEQKAMVSMVFMPHTVDSSDKLENFTVSRKVSHHPMRTRSMD